MTESLELHELKKISKILLLSNAETIEKEISKIANSETRKKMWVLLDGKRLQKDIAKEVGVTHAAVSYFITAGAAANLIEYNKGEAPSRILDYIPPSWIELAIKEGRNTTEKQTTVSSSITTTRKPKEVHNT